MSSITLRRKSGKQIIEYTKGETLLLVMQREGVSVSAPCGGNGRCGKCLVHVEMDGVLHQVLACKTPAAEGMTVILEKTANDAVDLCENPVLSDKTRFGAAVDLGTTTVAVRLVSLDDGEECGQITDWNTQRAFGADVISRAQYAIEQSGADCVLREMITSQITGMISLLCVQKGISLTQIERIALSGNTIMQYLALGLDPTPILRAPFVPPILFENRETYQFMQMPYAEVRPMPCVAGYVGGDIVSGIMALDLEHSNKLNLFLDIGTNGEMALGGRKGFLTCSVATGPAFEGAEITCGMANLPGAIKHVSLGKDDLEYTIEGDTAPKGICGSGLIDLLAVLLDLGLIDEGGRLLPPDELEEEPEILEQIPQNIIKRLSVDEDENGLLYLTDDHSVYLTAGDVRKLQLAKAAVAAGITVLMHECKVTPDELDVIYIAGGFGGGLNIESAFRIGMLPGLPQSQIYVVGNTSLLGASRSLINDASEHELIEIQKTCRYLELSGLQSFTEYFVSKMSFEEWEE